MMLAELRAKWIAFLCWYLGHRMNVINEWVDWGISEKRLLCERCGGNETWEREINTK